MWVREEDSWKIDPRSVEKAGDVGQRKNFKSDRPVRKNLLAVKMRDKLVEA